MDRGGPEREAASRRNTGRAWNSIRDKRVTGGQDDGFSKNWHPQQKLLRGGGFFCGSPPRGVRWQNVRFLVLPPPVTAANPPGASDVRSLLRGKKIAPGT